MCVCGGAVGRGFLFVWFGFGFFPPFNIAQLFI